MVQLLGKDVGTTGYGLMGLTWRSDPVSQEQAIEAMKTALAEGANFWNGGEFYGPPDRNSLQLLNAYFTKYPEDADKVVLSIKGGADLKRLWPDGSEEGIKTSVENCLSLLGGKKKLDIFECARVDPATPIEETMKYLNKYVEEGKIGAISLSEVGAESIRRAAKVAKICAVELELSLSNPDVLTNGIAAACAENNIPIVAYSPLGRGLLSGHYTSFDQVPKAYTHLPQIGDPENFENNLKLANAIAKLADEKSVTRAQLCLAWVKAQSGRNGNPVIIPIPGATTIPRIKENMKEIDLTEEDLAVLEKLQKENPIKGARYGGHGGQLMNG